jgi:hypothetical protein
MKIKRGRLQQIIQEELNAALKEMYNPENDDIYMITADLSAGGMELWPNMLNARVYNSFDEAHAEAKSITKRSVENKFYRAVSVTDVLNKMGRGHPQYNVVVTAAQMHLDKRAASDNDLDTDNDGKISVGELEKELQDIRDDLVDLDDLPWGRVSDPEIEGVIAAANAAGADLSGVIVDENTVDDLDDLDALAKAFKVSKTINHETEDASGTIELGKIKGKDIATWNVMGYTMWMR